jgi:tripartite-type tricarboxylate transporter receptor subunit TctC
MGGTGSKQEDQLIGALLETAAATRITYVPLKGGGDVARALAAGEVDMTVNNPIEAEALWRQGKLRPLCVFDGPRLAYPGKLADGQGWADLPTCMSVGIPAQYLMLRGSLHAWRHDRRVASTPAAGQAAACQWKDFIPRCLQAAAMSGPVCRLADKEPLPQRADARAC